jgi:hypothetical protein
VAADASPAENEYGVETTSLRASGLARVDRIVVENSAPAAGEYGIETTSLRAGGSIAADRLVVEDSAARRSEAIGVELAAIRAEEELAADRHVGDAAALDLRQLAEVDALEAAHQAEVDDASSDPEAVAALDLQHTDDLLSLADAHAAATAALAEQHALELQALRSRTEALIAERAALPTGYGVDVGGSLRATGDASFERSVAANRLVVREEGLGAGEFGIEASTVKAVDIRASGVLEVDRVVVNSEVSTTALEASGVATVDRLVVQHSRPTAGEYSIETKSVDAEETVRAATLVATSVEGYSLDAKTVNATQVTVTGLSSVLGTISTGGTVSAKTVTVSAWAALQDEAGNLEISRGQTKTAFRDAFVPLDRPRVAHCVFSGAAPAIGSLASATGAFSSISGSGVVTSATVSAAIPVLEETTAENAKRFVGVVASVETEVPVARKYSLGALEFAAPATDRRVAINLAGFGLVLANGEGGDIEIGDLLCASATPGQATRQADDAVKSSTVAKATAAHAFPPSGSPDGDSKPSALVACKYLC